ncbi:MAG: hypothetical protein ABI614_04805, partial [Planctomycetota bacterium]
YFLPIFTSPENRGALPEWRDTLLSKDLRTARSPEATVYLRGQVITYMKAFAQSPPPKYNFHPAVRYNAMLVIGDLNAVEYGSRYPNDQKAMVPEPLAEALDVLIAEYKSPTQIDAVRVAALVGIDRHVKLDLGVPKERNIPGSKKKAIVDEMIALLNSAPPAGRTAEGHTWMQRRAIDILAALGMVGAYPEANAALEKIVADNAAPISLRCTASEALAQWAPNSQQKVDAGTVSKNLGLIAIKACKDELDRIAALERQAKEMKQLRELIKKASPVASGQFGSATGGAGTGMDGMYGGEGYGGGGATGEQAMDPGMDTMYGGGMGMYGGMAGSPTAKVPTDPRIVWSQRRLKYQLTCVKHGLAGMSIAGKTSPQAKAIEQIAKAVDTALALTNPPADKPTLEGLTASIREGVRGLAFLAPEAAEIGAEPVVDLPVDGLPPAADPASPAAPAAAAATPAAPAAPVANPVAPPAEAALPTDLPPGL